MIEWSCFIVSISRALFVCCYWINYSDHDRDFFSILIKKKKKPMDQWFPLFYESNKSMSTRYSMVFPVYFCSFILLFSLSSIYVYRWIETKTMNVKKCLSVETIANDEKTIFVWPLMLKHAKVTGWLNVVYVYLSLVKNKFTTRCFVVVEVEKTKKMKGSKHSIGYSQFSFEKTMDTEIKGD